MLKKFTLVMAALVGAALVLIGCEQEAETETKYVNVPEMIHLDEVVSSEGDLRNELVDDGKELSIGVTGTVTLTAALTVPDKKAVYILPSAELDVDTFALTVDGIVYVGGTLTAESTGTVKIPGSGHVGVVKGGELSVETAASVNDGAGAPATVLGTGKVGFASEITLTLAATGTSALDITTALGYFSNGTLDASASAAVIALKPSEAVTAFGTLVSANKTLIITANGTETVSSLTVPAGLALTTSNTFATGLTTLTVNGTLLAGSGTFAEVAALTVNGGLYSAGTFAALTTVSGTGTLIAGAVVDGTAKFIIESSLKYASLASTTIDASSGLTIPANTVRIFTAAAAPSGNVTVNGTAIFSGAAAPAENVTVNGTLTVSSTGSLTIDAGKTLANAGTVALTGTGSLVLTSADSTGGAKITGAGKVTAGLTEIVGGTSGWQAVGTHSSDVTIASVSAVAASITAATGEVFTAQGAGATITQLPGASNALTIAANTEINLAGNGTTAAGKITLVSGPDPAKLAFGATSSKVLAGAGAGGSGIGGVTTVTIGGKAIVNGGLVAADYQNANSKLVQLGGTTQGNFTASVTPDQDVVIDSTVVAAGS